MNHELKNIRIARVSTIPFFVFTQLRGQLEALAASGAKVSIITSNDELTTSLELINGCHFHPIFIARKISIFADIWTVFKLWSLFRKERYHIVHSTTPKAGLLCSIAAKLAGISVCIHTFTGQAWVTMHGLKRLLVQGADKIIGKLNFLSFTDSLSQKDFLIKHNIVSAEKIKVIGSGSLAGVDIKRFSQERFSEEDKAQLKSALHIDASMKVLLFMGRINREKGIYELFEAVKYILQQDHHVVLIVVGPFDQNNEQEVRTTAKEHCGDRVRFVGFQAEPERYMAISDVLCLPSYREGFGTVVIEAAAMQVPVLGTNIYGLADAVINGVTGILVEPKNSTQLAEALEKIIADDLLRMKLGKQARERAMSEFDMDHLNKLLIQEYKQLLGNVTL